jgi:uncharacterized protein YfiM (DUF2279 family)
MTTCAGIAALIVACAGGAAGPAPVTPLYAPPPLALAAPLPIDALGAAAPGPVDPWVAQDKLRHLAMSFAATAFAYAGARVVLEPDPATATAGIAALGAGVGKEVYDARAGGAFSPRDLVWNAAGVALGLLFVHRIR